MKKHCVKILTLGVIILSLVLFASVAHAEANASSVVASGSCGDNLRWELDGMGVLTISGNGAMTNFPAWKSPWYDKKSQIISAVLKEGVTTVGSEAFTDCKNMTTVSLPNSLKSISDHAFYYSGLTSIRIPDSVTSIGWSAFNGCIDLTEINIPQGVTTIEEYTFVDCYSLTSIVLPDGVTSIGQAVFVNSGLTSISIPATVTSIDWRAFDNCTALTDVWYGGIQTQWNNLLKNVQNENDVLLTANIHFNSIAAGTCGDNLTWELDSMGVLTISGTGTMNNYRFYEAPWNGYNTEVADVVLESGVTSIGNCAFMDCANLRSITIPDSVFSIGDYALFSCSSLTSIIIPNDVTSIGTNAFGGCSSLTSITIPNGVTSISADTFDGCSSLTIVIIPNSVTSIGEYAFGFCSDLASIIIPDSVTSIGNSAFIGCTSLSSITIPDSVISIGNLAFYNCTSLENVFYYGTLAQAENIDGIEYYGNTDLRSATWYYHYGKEHTEIIAEAVAPTCTETGLSGGKYCPDCGKVLEEPHILPTINHHYDFSPEKLPTCTEDGYTESYSCVNCGNALVTAVPLKATGHKAVPVAEVPATCLEVGYTAGSRCETCGETLSGCEVVAALGHSYVIVNAKSATCVTDGNSRGIECKRCGFQYLPYEIYPATGEHQYVNGACEMCGLKVELSSFTVLRLPKSIKRIEKEAFYGSAAQVIIVPDGCEMMEQDAFAGCNSLLYLFVLSGMDRAMVRASVGSADVQIIYQ